MPIDSLSLGCYLCFASVIIVNSRDISNRILSDSNDFDVSRESLQPIAFGVLFHLNLQSQSPRSLFNGTWQKRPRGLDHRLRFENEEMTLQMQ